METDVQRYTLAIIEAIQRRAVKSDPKEGVTIDHVGIDALSFLLRVLRSNDDGKATAYVLGIALEVLAEAPARSPAGTLVSEVERRGLQS